MRAVYVDKHLPRLLAVKTLRRLWPGVVYSPLAPSRFGEVGPTTLPGRRWIRVENLLCGICASDVALLRVEADPKISPAALPSFERLYLGHEVVSRVVEVGPEVDGLGVGDRVVMDTRFQGPSCPSQEIEPPCPPCAEGQHARCENATAGIGPRGVGGGWGDGYTAHASEVYRVPEALDDDQAMMIEPISVAMRAVLMRRPPERGRALVIGSGIVGLNTVQCLKAAHPSCSVTLMARHAHQEALARRLGADEVVRGEDGYDATARITGARVHDGLLGTRTALGGFDVVYDCVGSAITLRDALRWTRAGGSVVMLGIEFAPVRIDLSPIWHQEVELVGVFAHGAERWHGELRHTYDVVAEALGDGRLVASELITHRFPLERWRQAVAVSRDKMTGSVKVALDLRPTADGPSTPGLTGAR